MRNDIEIWKPVVGWEAEYQVSSFGRILSVARFIARNGGSGWQRERILSPSPDKDGYLQLSLSRNGVAVKRKVHTLVLEAFVGPCPDNMQACHGDGEPSNNRLTNLRWDTASANNMDKYAHGTDLNGERSPNAVLSSADVVEIKRSLMDGVSGRQLAARFSVTPSLISKIRHGRAWRLVTA